MSAIPDVQLGGFEYTLPLKTGMVTGDERLPVALNIATAGTAQEINLSALIGNSPGCWISIQVRDAGPAYVGMNKSATSGVTLTNGTGSLGVRIQASDPEQHFWVERKFPFIEVNADTNNTHIVYRRSNINRNIRDDAMATGH